ncbi:hypothetical protein J2Z83_003573 [Virgibacillus natechei]|uniref:Uncharacterized protein n=1 Tax=Virgibacillus natechei TaxID=1216297 RepID=A0ABS4IKE8_9BACI|nr:hypothetical protein [Virgibacillus natechei]MBP1971434.1 hypothetical protein [Virgibacillus natechei]UZD13804.1 hypothetical protein OLD84_04430 [Virgibacillus natechei]
MLVNGLKLGGVDNFATDSYEAGTNVYDGIQGYRDFQEARNLAGGADDLTEAGSSLNTSENGSDVNRNSSRSNLQRAMDRIPSPPEPVEKALSKLSLPAAALGTLYIRSANI